VQLRLRDIEHRHGREFWPFHELGPHRGPQWPEEVLRLVVQFADGRSVSSLDQPTGFHGCTGWTSSHVQAGRLVRRT
jgi:hypothetical protein